MEDLQDAVTWQELLEQTFADTELSNLKEAIARIFEYFTTRERHLHRPQYDSIFTETAGVGGLIVRGAGIVVPREEEGGAHPTLPLMSNSHCVLS